MEFKLSNFITKIYGIDIEEYVDESTYNFDYISARDIYDFEGYCERFKQEYSEYADTSEDVFEEAANIRYRYSYVDEYYKAVKGEIADKIERDIQSLNIMFSEGMDEIYVEGKIDVDDVDFANDVIRFTGKNKIDKLASIVLNSINGYGMFVYQDLEEFYYANDAYTEEDKIGAIESHLHWLKHFEDIYGTIYNIGRIDLGYIDRYGTFGDFEFTKEDVEIALESF